MKFIFKSNSALRGDFTFINVNYIESIMLFVTYNHGRKEPLFYYRLNMVSENYHEIREETDIKEVESLLLESGISSAKIEELKRRMAPDYNRDRI